MSKTIEQVVSELDSDLPRSAVQTREGGNGMKLSYVSGYYVVDRLNKVLGIGNWAYNHKLTLISDATGKTTDRFGKDKYQAAYLAEVTLAIDLPGGKTTQFIDIGFGNGTDSNAGKAHESASKEAVTDGLKRCAKNLGMSMGLALYDKAQENVSDEKQTQESAQPAAKTTGNNATLNTPLRHTGRDNAAAVNAAVKEAEKAVQTNDSANVGDGVEREKVIRLIGTTSRVVIAKRKKTVEELTADLSKFGVSKKEDLTLDNAKTFLNQLKELAQ